MAVKLGFPVLILVCSSSAWAGGSSGVGNARPIGDGIVINAPEGSLLVSKAEISDAKTREKLLSIRHLTPSEIEGLKKDLQVVPAKLGAVEGLERIPAVGEKTPRSYWVVCSKPRQCLQLVPLSTSNPKVPSAVSRLSIE